MNKKIARLFFIPCFTILSYSCVNSDFDLSNISNNLVLQDETVSVPIGEAKTTIGDLLKKINFENLILSGDSIYLNLRDTMSFVPDNQVEVKSVSVVQDLTVPSLGGHYDFDVNHQFSVSTSGAQTRVDSVRICGTRLKLFVYSGLSNSINLQVVLPEGIVLTNPAQAKITIKPGDNTNYLDISDNSMLKFKNDASNPYFTIRYIVDIPSSGSFALSPLHFDFLFESIKMKVIYGNFPDVNAGEIKKDLYVDFFNDIFTNGSSLHFHNPTIKCMIKNYLGVKTKFNLNNITAYDEKGASASADFNGSPGYTLTLDRSQKLYEPSISYTTFCRSMGNINNFFLIEPKKFTYSVAASTVAEPGENNFIATDKCMDIIMNMQLPFTFDKGSMLIVRDTLNMDISEINKKVKLNDIVLRVNYSNMLPVKSILATVFLDENRKPVGEICEKHMELKNATVDASGYAISESNGTTWLKFDQSETAAISKIKFIVLKVTVAGNDNNTRISLRPSDYIHLKAALYVNGDISIKN
ncbi:MAG TPA: hypothetical protein PKH58_06765 [Paludibacteraceae bacterium]|nr:hypothetical protein [Paludibacteraceae bacterium]